ncbi:MAG TPA: MBOAT family protein [Firmicutes bacterium]|nr:MBOAT family protein [Bacillota bacterium]
MVFSNLIFLYLFLPANFLCYFATKKQIYRNIVLILFSLFFYAWGEPVWITLLLFSATIDYFHGRLAQKYRGKIGAKLAVASSLVLNLGLLAVFKYSGLIIQTVNQLTGLSISAPGWGLPIGISFYTFQTIAYVIDVYRGKVEAQRSYLNFLLFVSLYHRLVAGPIVRYEEVQNDFDQVTITAYDMSEGISRFCVGLFKKVFVANVAGEFVAIYMDGNIAALSSAGAWFGALMYTLQIYYDFSGYSDMALGLGRMFGSSYNENFQYPYIAKSATDFWRRWHISLSSFFRDYLYIPLGGNRKHQYLNLFIVWGLTGLWHGASWNFVLWGLYYGVLICLERLFLRKVLEKIPAFFSHLYLLFITVVGWVIFYYTDSSQLFAYLGKMFSFSGGFPLELQLQIVNNIFWILLSAFFCMPVVPFLRRVIREKFPSSWQEAAGIGQVLLTGFLLLSSTALLVGQSYNPFLYFHF